MGTLMMMMMADDVNYESNYESEIIMIVIR